MLRSLPRASVRTRELTRENSRACAVILPLCPVRSVRVDFLFDLFSSFDVLFVWFVPRNGP